MPAFTTPRTWTDGELIEAATIMNVHVRDNLAALKIATLAKSSNYPIVAADGLHVEILVDTTSGTVTITLPAAASSAGVVVTCKKKVAANTMTIDGNGAETIDGAASISTTAIYSSRTVICDGTTWWIIGSYA